MKAPFTLVTGHTIDLANPNLSTLSRAQIIQAIATGLAHTNRFCGQTSKPYSVAEHCILGALYLTNDPAIRLHFLLHDAPEGLGLGDVVKPLKNLLPDYPPLEDLMLREIYRTLDLQLPTPRQQAFVDEMDRTMYLVENDVLRNGGDPKSSGLAFRLWAARWHDKDIARGYLGHLSKLLQDQKR